MAKEAKQQESFEQIYGRLEESVAKLETGGLPLEQSIALFEAGMTLARTCQERLDDAELKVTKLRESFAPIPERQAPPPTMLRDAADIEYVADDDDPVVDDDPFA